MKKKLLLVFISLLILGVFFRFLNLDRKFYWVDESFTSLRISGYTATEVVHQVTKEQFINVKDLQKYQHSNSDRGSIDTLKSLLEDTPQHTPLYFLLVRLWVKFMGNSVAVTRSLSALISLLAFPCLYYLCRELFHSSTVGWGAMVLFAISPFQVLYAQEARPYSLWTVTILLSSITLLRALRLNNKWSWVIYGATVALGLYSFLLFTLVAIGHGVCVLATEDRWSKTIRAYLLASLLGLITFIPWLLALLTCSTSVAERFNSERVRLSLLHLTEVLLINTSRIFIDFDFDTDFSAYSYPLIFVDLIIFLLVLYSIVFLCYRTKKRVRFFVLTLILITLLTMLIPDLILGELQTTRSRYLTPSYLGIQISVAYLLVTKISTTLNNRRQKSWLLIMLVLLTSGILSCTVSSQAKTWWNKTWGNFNLPLAQVINQAERPLVISQVSPKIIIDDLSLSHLLKPEVWLQLVTETAMTKIPNGFSDIFLYGTSEMLRTELEKQQNFKIVPIYGIEKSQETWLWKLVKQ